MKDKNPLIPSEKEFGVVSLERRVTEIERKLNINDVEKRLKYLALRLQCEILKNCVISEVWRIYPHSPKVMDACEFSYDWWMEGKDLSIEEWHKRILNSDSEKELSFSVLDQSVEVNYGRSN